MLKNYINYSKNKYMLKQLDDEDNLRWREYAFDYADEIIINYLTKQKIQFKGSWSELWLFVDNREYDFIIFFKVKNQIILKYYTKDGNIEIIPNSIWKSNISLNVRRFFKESQLENILNEVIIYVKPEIQDIFFWDDFEHYVNEYKRVTGQNYIKDCNSLECIYDKIIEKIKGRGMLI